ncbi:hypothetical protein MTsPCn9_30630 [Croceitalea sp. MTPC9]|uniref:hypothetical protein n=1 Tax=unclassified Croceitalea TaxID=2632280 RepID=UPI002B3A1DC4|nr:hypothetical protein MTsPCn6_21020 [Croceitalea sp. MTPC6]GMN18123.1 hypothetical protein MTsPCn9_30630 [Croceitalea sp. MTPC9]
MSEFFKAELKDKFLQYASDRDDYFEVQLLYDEFLRPNYSLQFVEKLVREIIDYNPNLLDIMSGNGSKIFMLSATAFTEEFIEEGGFKDMYIEEEEKWDTFLSQLSNSRKLSTEEKVSLGKTEKTSYKRERNLLFFLISAVSLSFLFTLFSIVNDLFFESGSITKSELDAKLTELKEQNRKEKEALLKEISDLKLNLESFPLDSLAKK